jgi:hypothetical protein
MKRRTLTQVILVGPLITLACTTIAVVPAGASGPMITVTPNTGLTDGQVVTVVASGFTFAVPDYAGIEECTLGPPSVATCDPSTTTILPVASDDYTSPYTVHRYIDTTNSGLVDCAVPNSCEIHSGDIAAQQDATAPIAFTAPQVDLSIIRARSITHVKPGDPVEVRVRSLNRGPASTTWSLAQTVGSGLETTGEKCGAKGIAGPNGCAYSSKVGHAVNTVLELVALPGFAGPTTDAVCVHDENPNDADPNPSNNCATVTLTVRQ